MRVPTADAPPPGALRLVPLGGLGEVGMNCLVVEQGDDTVLIDCGVRFPERDEGVDVLHPSFGYLRDKRLRAVVVTHGHEDHIGALPFLIREIGHVPIFGPRHALALIRHRLLDSGVDLPESHLQATEPRHPFDVGSFRFEPIRVTHSIAQATALAIDTEVGKVVHTGDFKLDPSPTDGETTDSERLRELGDEGVRLLLSDSTNADTEGWTRSEGNVADALAEQIQAAPHRVVVGLFASNQQRLRALGEIAQRTRRAICLVGRSMSTHVRAGHEAGSLKWPSDLVVSPDIAARLPRERVLLLATGTQAETRAALNRIGTGTHPRIRLERGDRLIMSSRAIPGSERVVAAMVDRFYRLGVDVVLRNESPVHASGHAHREEQQQMLSWVRPETFMPVHGTLRHLHRHAELARAAGVEHIAIVENGQMVELTAQQPPTPMGRIAAFAIPTYAGRRIASGTLEDRRTIARHGVVFVSVTLGGDGRTASDPIVQQVGVTELGSDAATSLEADVRSEVVRALKRADGRKQDDELQDELKRAVTKLVDATLGFRPYVRALVARTRSDV